MTSFCHPAPDSQVTRARSPSGPISTGSDCGHRSFFLSDRTSLVGISATIGSTIGLAEWHTVPIGGVVVVEGVYSTRDELAGSYDVTIWLECPPEIRLARGIARNGESMREIWEQDWMVAEDLYIQHQHPELRADVLIDSSGQVEHDPSAEFICLVHTDR